MCGREARSVRRRCMTYSSSSEGNDPYENEVLLDEHFRDLARFVSLASTSNRVVAIAPFNIGVSASPAASRHYNHCVAVAMAHGLPI